MGFNTFKKIVLEEGALKYGFTRKLLRRLPHALVEHSGTEPFMEDSDPLDMGKGTLHLLNFRGDFLKPCPGTRNYICCGYQILNLATNCPLDCSYCILQAYINQPGLRIFANLEEALKAVFHQIDSNPERIFRIGTGEFTDSLALDDITRLSERLIPEFSRRKNTILEFKTKTDRVEGLIASDHRDRIIVSWSLNSPYIAEHEEHRAPGLRKRLEAARRCQDEGFVLGFHFDPIVCHKNWKDGYLKTIELMDRYIDPKRIIWVSLGSFRYMPDLKPIIRRRHPETCVLNGEFIAGLDGKMRYFKPIRIDLYSLIREHLENWHSDTGLYLCMESDDVWKKSLGWSPKDSKGLAGYLDGRVQRFFR